MKKRKLSRIQLRRMLLKETRLIKESLGLGLGVMGLSILAAFGFTALEAFLGKNKTKVVRPYEVGGDYTGIHESAIFGSDDYQVGSGQSSVGLTGIMGAGDYSEEQIENMFGTVPKRVAQHVQSGKSEAEAVSLALKEDEAEAQKFLKAVADLTHSPITGINENRKRRKRRR